MYALILALMSVNFSPREILNGLMSKVSEMIGSLDAFCQMQKPTKRLERLRDVGSTSSLGISPILLTSELQAME